MNIRHRYGRAYLLSDKQRFRCGDLYCICAIHTTLFILTKVEQLDKGAALLLTAISGLLLSLATASPWTLLGRVYAPTAPPLTTCEQREVIVMLVITCSTNAAPPAQPISVVAKYLLAVVQTGLNVAVAINVGLVQASGVVETRTFAMTRAALLNFNLQQRCPL